MTVPRSVLSPKVTPLPLSQVRRQLSEYFCWWCAIKGQHLLAPLPGTNIFVPGQPLFLLVFTFFPSLVDFYSNHSPKLDLSPPGDSTVS